MSDRRALVSFLFWTALAWSAAEARAEIYTLDDESHGGIFAICQAGGNVDYKYEQFPDPTSLDEHFFSQATSGTGICTGDAVVHFSTTNSTITARGSIADFAYLGDATSMSIQTESFMEVFFSVPEMTAFQLESATTFSVDPPDFDLDTVVVLIRQLDYANGASGFVGPSGILTPGQYVLTGQVKVLTGSVFGEAPVTASATFDYTLTLTPLVVPARESTWGRIKQLYAQ